MFPPMPNHHCTGLGWAQMYIGKKDFRLDFNPQVQCIPWGIWLCEQRNRAAGKVPIEILGINIGCKSQFITSPSMPFEAFNLQWFRLFKQDRMGPGICLSIHGRMVTDFPFQFMSDPKKTLWKRYTRPRVFVSGVVAFEPVPMEKPKPVFSGSWREHERKEKEDANEKSEA